MGAGGDLCSFLHYKVLGLRRSWLLFGSLFGLRWNALYLVWILEVIELFNYLLTMWLVLIN